MTASKKARVVAVCVTFNPQPARLRQVLHALSNQVSAIQVIDNSESEQVAETVESIASAEGSLYHWSGRNQGLAHGFNVGIESALDQHCSHVLLMDQDSLASGDMVQKLLAAEADEHQAGLPPVAALGPVYEDPRAGRRSTFARYRKFPPKRLDPISQPPVFDADMLISSGSLIPRHALKAIGLMDEELFIDHIDTDWCLRALFRGYRLVAVQGARMQHNLGERWVRIGRHSLPLHSAERMYFMFRNSWLLYQRDYAGWPWILADLRRLCVVTLLHIFAADRRSLALIRMIQGTKDGILGRTGKQPSKDRLRRTS